MDENTFTERAMALERKLFRISHTLLRADADCEDAVQEALINAWLHRSSLREERYFDTWLIRILLNACKNLRRGQRIMAEIPEQYPAREEGDRQVHEALMGLPEKLRLAMVLHYIEGYEIKQIAEILKIPAGTVKWRLHEGRAALRRQIEKEGF